MMDDEALRRDSGSFFCTPHRYSPSSTNRASRSRSDCRCAAKSHQILLRTKTARLRSNMPTPRPAGFSRLVFEVRYSGTPVGSGTGILFPWLLAESFRDPRVANSCAAMGLVDLQKLWIGWKRGLDPAVPWALSAAAVKNTNRRRELRQHPTGVGDARYLRFDGCQV